MRTEIATREHEPALRELTMQSMPTWIRLAYPHSPDFFRAEALKGFRVDSFVVLDTDGRVGGCGTRSLKRVWLDGSPATVGYLGNMRSFPHARKKSGLFRAYEFFKRFSESDDVPFYFSSILRDNRAAIAILTSRRARLPRYEPCGDICSFATHANALGIPSMPTASRFTIERGDETDLAALTAFYNEQRARRQLFPVFNATLFSTPEFASLRLSDFIVIRRDREIVAATALWDQQAMRQIRVEAYAPLLAAARPFLNPVSRLLRYPTLPPPGSCIAHNYLAFLSVRDDSPEIFSILLTAAAARLGKAILLFALHERDPLFPVARQLRAWRYWSTLYCVTWQENPFALKMLQQGIPYFELAGV